MRRSSRRVLVPSAKLRRVLHLGSWSWGLSISVREYQGRVNLVRVGSMPVPIDRQKPLAQMNGGWDDSPFHSRSRVHDQEQLVSLIVIERYRHGVFPSAGENAYMRHLKSCTREGP